MLSTSAHKGHSGFGYKSFSATTAGRKFAATSSMETLPPMRLSPELMKEESTARRGRPNDLPRGVGVGPAGVGQAVGESQEGSGLAGAEMVLFQRLTALRSKLAEETTKAKRINCAPWMVRNKRELSWKSSDLELGMCLRNSFICLRNFDLYSNKPVRVHLCLVFFFILSSHFIQSISDHAKPHHGTARPRAPYHATQLAHGAWVSRAESA